MRVRWWWVGLVLSLGMLPACGGPYIENTQVTPSTFQVSGIVNTANFTVTTDVLHFGEAVSSVSADVEGKNITLALVKQQDIPAGERWSQTTQLTLWNGVSAGVYEIDITATSSKGNTVTQTHAASVTVTSGN
jgi:hypothetical protein